MGEPIPLLPDGVSKIDMLLIERVVRAIPPEKRAEAMTRLYLNALASVASLPDADADG